MRGMFRAWKHISANSLPVEANEGGVAYRPWRWVAISHLIKQLFNLIAGGIVWH